jgi:glucokinase-like ROK family protein
MYTTSYKLNVRSLNKRTSLDLIRFTPGGIARAEIARRLGLTRSAVTVIVKDLLENGLVREAENITLSGGGRPVALEIDPSRGYFAGVDIGVSHLGLLVTDFSSRVILDQELAFNLSVKPDQSLEFVHQSLVGILERSGLGFEDLHAVGIGVPGPVLEEAGAVSSPPIMPGWDLFPIRDTLEERWRLMVTLNNDAELGALGEWAFGAGRGCSHLVYIKVGSGVGAGILIDGVIYGGTLGLAGEIGHIPVREDGPGCACGNYGCLEALAGGKAIARQAREAVMKGRRTHLSRIVPPEAITAKDVVAAARLGDILAQEIVKEAGMYLGIVIANLVNLLNPSMVVVGGGVAQMGDLLLQPIRQAVQERSLKSAAKCTRITAAVLERRSTSLGAVVQAQNAVLDQIMEIA